MASQKLLRASQGSDIEHKGDMSSMIDMVFLLLIFFMVSASFVKIPLDPRVDVAVADEASEDSDYTGRIVLNVFSDEVTNEEGYRWADVDGNELADEAAVTKYIKERIESMQDGVEAKLQLRADASVNMQYVTDSVAAALEDDNELFSIMIGTTSTKRTD